MDTTIIFAHDVECAKSEAAFNKIVKLGSLAQEDTQSLGETFHYNPPEKGDARLLGLLDTALSVVGQHMPKLTEMQWHILLNLVARPGVIDPRYVGLMKVGARDSGAAPEDLEVFSKLQPVEWLAVALVNNRIHSVTHDCPYGTRGAISEFTGEPYECVYADDPTIGESWTLRGIQQNGVLYTAHWTFIDGTDAYLTLDSSDAKYLVYKAFECDTSRHLAPAATSLKWFLLRVTADAVDKHILEKESEKQA